jgi:hypothetical protein
LRSWAPRRPSARLEERLFATPALALVSPHAALTFRFTWLGPVTAALLMLCLVFNQRYSTAWSGAAKSGPLVAMIMSNQSAAPYLSSSFQPEQNTIPAETIERTNGNGPISGVSGAAAGHMRQ